MFISLESVSNLVKVWRPWLHFIMLGCRIVASCQTAELLMLTFKMFLQLWSPNTERPFPSPYGAALRAFLQALLCMGTYMYLLPRVPLSKFESLEYQKWGFWHRLGYMYLSGLTARWKYYFIWSISEVSVIISGLGFSGWATSGPSSDATPKWTRAKNVDIAKVELAKSGVSARGFVTVSFILFCEFPRRSWLVVVGHCTLWVDAATLWEYITWRVTALI